LPPVSELLFHAERGRDGLTTHGDSQQRYDAALALRASGRDLWERRYLIDNQTGEVVLLAADLATAARRYTGSTVPWKELDARMEELGWERVYLQGYELRGRNGRRAGGHAHVHIYRRRLADDEGAVNR
jgi:hypothetical protein